MNNIMPLDIFTLNEQMIRLEDILFALSYDNISEVATNAATTLEIIIEILSNQEQYSTTIISLNDLVKIYQVIASHPNLINNLIINATLQALKLSYCIIINEEAQYITSLRKTCSVIQNLLVSVNGEKLEHPVSTMADIITYIRKDSSVDIDFFSDDEIVIRPPIEKKLKILIVDDEPMYRILMDKIVAPYGICDSANNGQTAVRMFNEALDRQTPYDLITLDIMMPIMDGQQTLKMIRRSERERGIAVDREVNIFMVSSMDGEHVLEAFFRGRCTDYIKKPYSQEKVLDKMRSNRLIS